MTQKQCKYGNHLSEGDSFIEQISSGVRVCMKCIGHPNSEPQGVIGDGWGWGYYNINNSTIFTEPKYKGNENNVITETI